MDVGYVADENFPRSALAILRSAGLDIEWVREFAPGLPDELVLVAARLRGRILLTFDSDFGRLVIAGGEAPPRGIVYFRAKPGTEAEVALRLLEVLQIPSVRFDGFLTTVQATGHRQRVLPGT